MAETPASPDTPERRRAAAHEFIKAVSPSEEIGSPLDLISRRGVERPTREQIAHGRMLPNVDAALTALDGGAARVRIIDGRQPHAVVLALPADRGVGTELVRGGEEGKLSLSATRAESGTPPACS